MDQRLIRWSLFGILWGLCATGGAAQEVASLLLAHQGGRQGRRRQRRGEQGVEGTRRQGPRLCSPMSSAAWTTPARLPLNWLRAAVESIQDKAIYRKAKKSLPTRSKRFSRTRATPAIRAGWLTNAWSASIRPRRTGCCPRCSTTRAPSCAATPSPSNSNTARTRFQELTRKQFYQDLLIHARDRDQVDAICKELKTRRRRDRSNDPLRLHHALAARRAVRQHQGCRLPERLSAGTRRRYQGQLSRQGGASRPLAGARHRRSRSAWSISTKSSASSKAQSPTATRQSLPRPNAPSRFAPAATMPFASGSTARKSIFREEYHHGMEMDQHVGKGMLESRAAMKSSSRCARTSRPSPGPSSGRFSCAYAMRSARAVPVVNGTEKVK